MTWQQVVLWIAVIAAGLAVLWALVALVLVRCFWAMVRAMDDDTNAMQRHGRRGPRPTDPPTRKD